MPLTVDCLVNAVSFPQALDYATTFAQTKAFLGVEQIVLYALTPLLPAAGPIRCERIAVEVLRSGSFFYPSLLLLPLLFLAWPILFLLPQTYQCERSMVWFKRMHSSSRALIDWVQHFSLWMMSSLVSLKKPKGKYSALIPDWFRSLVACCSLSLFWLRDLILLTITIYCYPCLHDLSSSVAVRFSSSFHTGVKLLKRSYLIFARSSHVCCSAGKGNEQSSRYGDNSINSLKYAGSWSDHWGWLTRIVMERRTNSKVQVELMIEWRSDGNGPQPLLFIIVTNLRRKRQTLCVACFMFFFGFASFAFLEFSLLAMIPVVQVIGLTAPSTAGGTERDQVRSKIDQCTFISLLCRNSLPSSSILLILRILALFLFPCGFNQHSLLCLPSCLWFNFGLVLFCFSEPLIFCRRGSDSSQSASGYWWPE